jgi:polar amino acid transport system substrate-binding protein
LAIGAVASPARADDSLDRVKQRGVLIWGGDQEGGGPYIYPRPDDPKQVTGFEVDLMALLAARMGVRSQFKQCDWKTLPDLLRIGDIDCITNGYELTDAHRATKIATLPYYVYELGLMARRDDATITSWDSLGAATGSRKKVGVLGGSAAEKHVAEKFGSRVEIKNYDGTTDALQDVVNGRLDASVQDLPPLIFYRDRYPQLHLAGPPAGRGYYVMYLRPEDERLRDEINDGLRELIADGRLRQIYERYGLWNPAQEQLRGPEVDVQTSTQVRGWEVIARNLPLLLQSAGMTVLLAVVSMPLAIVVGLAVALGRLYGPRPLAWLLAAYVEVLRGTPLLLQLFTIFFVLPALGLRIEAFWAAILGLAINYSAYEAEIYRAGLLAIPVSQMEAALALGMSRREALRRVIVPQAVRLVVPPVTNDFIALFKDTSICSVITIVELTKRYSILANSTGAYLELAAVTALLYLLMSYPLSLLARRLEARQARPVL